MIDRVCAANAHPVTPEWIPIRFSHSDSVDQGIGRLLVTSYVSSTRFVGKRKAERGQQWIFDLFWTIFSRGSIHTWRGTRGGLNPPTP